MRVAPQENSMNNELLTLKYRPHRLGDVIGQRHVTTVLQRIIERDTLPTAFIFSGPRGTGKTSVARILGAQLNCTESNPPCGHCPSCVDIIEARSSAVMEIDSATNGLVDNVKTILGQLRFASSKYQIALFDEAHAISKAGFNAMLKTVEEGAYNTIFVFVTTEPEKIPLTIQSRSMPFEFIPINPVDIIARIKLIMEAESIKYSDEVLPLIVRQSAGALRDAVMLVDQLNRGFGEVTIQAFESTFGADVNLLFIKLVNAIHQYDVTSMDSVIEEVMLQISDPMAVVESWIDFELSVLKGARFNFDVLHSKDDVLVTLEVLWFLTDKLRVIGRNRALLRIAAVIMSARVNQKILTTQEAFALLA